jgi:cell division protein FtsN
MNFAQSRKFCSRRAHRSMRGGVVLGIFLGLILGLAIAAAIAFYFGRSGPLPGASKDASRAGKTDIPAGAGAPEKPRFDFYKILPGAEEPRIGAERKAPDKSVDRPVDKPAPDAVAKSGAAASAVKPADRIWLQAGAFASQSDAESLKARLALAGWEAAVQSATVPDQGIRYRVRVGPFDNTDEVNRVKAELGKSGFDASVIKNQ